METPRVTAPAVGLAAGLAFAWATAFGPVADAAEEARPATVLVAQASPAPAPGGYDPLAQPRPVNPMAPGAPEPAGDGVALNPELGDLPDTPGVEETFYLCSACHSLAIIKQQRLPPARWDYLWNWMVEEQGMPEQDPETKDAILAYLKRHFSWTQ